MSIPAPYPVDGTHHGGAWGGGGKRASIRVGVINSQYIIERKEDIVLDNNTEYAIIVLGGNKIMDCEKVDELTASALAAIDLAWSDGLAIGDSLTALNHLNNAVTLINKAIGEIQQ